MQKLGSTVLGCSSQVIKVWGCSRCLPNQAGESQQMETLSYFWVKPGPMFLHTFSKQKFFLNNPVRVFQTFI